MYFKQFLDERCGCASYLVASRQSHEAAIIDPSIALEEYDTLLAQRGFRLRYVIDTHIHADHVSGARRLAAKHGGEVCLHEGAQVAYPFRPLQDGEELALGQLRLRVLHTPGHRPELISILVLNPERSPEPSMVLTGDSLLVGDVGRPDFGGGDAVAQYESLGRLLRLPDWVAVFPTLRRTVRQGDVRPAEYDHWLRAPLQPTGAPRTGPVHRPPDRGGTGPPAQHHGDRGDQSWPSRPPVGDAREQPGRGRDQSRGVGISRSGHDPDRRARAGRVRIGARARRRQSSLKRTSPTASTSCPDRPLLLICQSGYRRCAPPSSSNRWGSSRSPASRAARPPGSRPASRSTEATSTNRPRASSRPSGPTRVEQRGLRPGHHAGPWSLIKRSRT